MFKKALIILSVIMLLGVFYSVGSQIYESLQVARRLDKETENLTKLQQKNEELKKRLTEVQGVGFIEQQARDKLNMTRPGETLVIIPQQQIDQVLSLEQEKKEEVIAYWQGWLKLFWK